MLHDGKLSVIFLPSRGEHTEDIRFNRHKRLFRKTRRRSSWHDPQPVSMSQSSGHSSPSNPSTTLLLYHSCICSCFDVLCFALLCSLFTKRGARFLGFWSVRAAGNSVAGVDICSFPTFLYHLCFHIYSYCLNYYCSHYCLCPFCLYICPPFTRFFYPFYVFPVEISA
jgi:hypothetical protein